MSEWYFFMCVLLCRGPCMGGFLVGHSNGWDCLACAVLLRTALLFRAQLCAILVYVYLQHMQP